MAQRQVPEEVETKQSSWYRASKKWYRIHYALGITAIVLSGFVAIPLLSPDWNPIVGVLTGISAGLVTFLKPSERAKGYHAANCLLSLETEKYRLDEQYTPLMLVAAQERGQKIIDGN